MGFSPLLANFGPKETEAQYELHGRTPEELMDIIETKGREIAQLLKTLREIKSPVLENPNGLRDP